MVISSVNVATGLMSVAVCFVLIAYQLMTHKKTKSDKWLNMVIISNILMSMGDISDCGLGGKPGPAVYILMSLFSLVIFYSASGLLLFSMLGWMVSVVDQKKKLSKWWIRIGAVFTLVQILLSVTMPITGICYIDKATNTYTRGDLFVLTQIFPYLVFFMGVAVLFMNFKQLNRKERLYLSCFTFVPMIADLVQVFSRYTIMNVVVSIGLVMVILLIQNQRAFAREEEAKKIILQENEKLEDMTIRQENLNSQLIDVLCGTVEAKDIYTRGHSMRVAQYAREIMYRLGGDEKAQQEVYCIGILHDVGKISVPDEIINKKGRLTDEEYEQIKLHTVAGYQILRGVDIIPDLAIGARWHHERYDGKGYPNGLAGENIPLIARIISVADAYDAMTSNRSYHSVMPQSQVREQIEKGMGTQFDPKIAQIMLDMIDEDLQYEMRQINYTRIVNILMIDDDTFIHDLVNKILGDENYLLTFASSGEEGIELMKKNKYDLCLLDMEMPGMNGFEVLEWIHNNIRKMKVIFLTGDKSSRTIRRSEELGAVDYLTKPINVRFLKESINSVLTH